MKKTTEICCYCDNIATTKDHVLSRALFPDQYKTDSQQITVPSCKACNGSMSKDEEYFRNFLTYISGDKSPIAESVFNGPVRRSILRRRSIGLQALNRMSLVETYTPSNIYIGKRTKVSITSTDWQRYFRVLDKIIKGLIYHETGRKVPPSYRLLHMYATDNKNAVDYGSKYTKILRIPYAGIFAYRFDFVPEKVDSMWFTQFYGHMLFLSFVVDHESFEKWKTKGSDSLWVPEV